MIKIQERFGKELPLVTLFQAPTIEDLAPILRTQADPLPLSPLVEIQPGAANPPFFCVHPVGGNVLCYFALSQLLGSDQPFYGLQSVGLDGRRKPSVSIEEMGGHSIGACQTLQPREPHVLGGL